MLRFAGFEIDRQRAELRGSDGEVIKLRPKTFDMLLLFAANAGRALSKQELMDAVWPQVHVSDDSLFKCIREIRAALGDNQRQIIRLVSGHGYLFDAEVTNEPTVIAVCAKADNAEPHANAAAIADVAKTRRFRFARRGPTAFAVVAALGTIFGLAVAAPIFGPDLIFPRQPSTIAVMPIVDTSNDSQITAMAAGVTTRLIDGLAKIDNVRVVTQQAGAATSSAKPVSASFAAADFVVTGELQRSEHTWILQARMIKSATKEIQSLAPISVDIKDSDPDLQESRLVAGAGHQLALRINTLLTRPETADGRSPAAGAKVAIEQATASIIQTSRDRFAVAQTMLENALAGNPDNVDLQVALAALQLRGIQMVWYSPEDSAAAGKNAKSMLESALRARPNSIPALQAYCRFLNATNEFVESLVACAKTLTFDPWDGIALYHMGLAHIQLGRFDDALAAFKQADRFDTPRVSRWTWLLGVGMTYMLMDRSEDAVPWLRRSIAITAGSGRTHMLLAAAYERLGRPAEAKAAMEKALELRPGSNLANVSLPPKNASPVFLAASKWIGQAFVTAGLPEH